ncbi:MAG: phage baseplate assembly protein V [Rhizomicrobium sp.]
MDSPEQSISDLIRKGRIHAVTGKLCTVETGDMITGPLPWITVRAGRTRTWSAPSVGEQCLLICAEGETENGVVLPGLYSDAFDAPEDSPDQDVTLYADGARIAYDAKAHALTATLPAGGTAAITAPGGIKITGPVEIDGTLKVTKSVAADEDVTASGISLKSHKHSAVKSGTDVSGGPQ